MATFCTPHSDRSLHECPLARATGLLGFGGLSGSFGRPGVEACVGPRRPHALLRSAGGVRGQQDSDNNVDDIKTGECSERSSSEQRKRSHR
jgi:hypothetical protein